VSLFKSKELTHYNGLWQPFESRVPTHCSFFWIFFEGRALTQYRVFWGAFESRVHHYDMRRKILHEKIISFSPKHEENLRAKHFEGAKASASLASPLNTLLEVRQTRGRSPIIELSSALILLDMQPICSTYLLTGTICPIGKKEKLNCALFIKNTDWLAFHYWFISWFYSFNY